MENIISAEISLKVESGIWENWKEAK
jgi:hypothetical protein